MIRIVIIPQTESDLPYARKVQESVVRDGVLAVVNDDWKETACNKLQAAVNMPADLANVDDPMAAPHWDFVLSINASNVRDQVVTQHYRHAPPQTWTIERLRYEIKKVAAFQAVEASNQNEVVELERDKEEWAMKRAAAALVDVISVLAPYPPSARRRAIEAISIIYR